MDASYGLTLRTRREGNAVVVSVSGELDYATAPELIKTIELNANLKIRLLLVNCTEVTFIDSEAVKALIKIQNELIQDGVDLRISECSRQVLRTLRLLGLESRFLVNCGC